MKKWIFSRYTVILLIVSVISLSAFKKSEDFELRKQIEIMLSIIKELKAIYVDEFGIADLMKKGMDAMLKSLDPYTVYYPETKIEDVRFMNSGKFGGIGILTKKVGVKFLVLDVLQGYSVHKSGVAAGDFITTVNGNSVANLTDEGFGELLQGSPGTTIELTVQKYSGEVVKLSPVREMVSIKSVPYYVFTADSVAYIKQTGFSETAAGEFETALKEMLAKKPKGIILDLRNNPGGLLIEAVKIVNFFVEQGVTVVSVRGKNAMQSQLFKTEREPLVPKLPLVVLVNNGSA
ncbi:MAG TPA: peptidase S41, partial [Bacteroidales bacterium]|nr:peptidase S41 [Bacteroidales bacterium]